jgi:hypothetical protein
MNLCFTEAFCGKSFVCGGISTVATALHCTALHCRSSHLAAFLIQSCCQTPLYYSLSTVGYQDYHYSFSTKKK